ncbi:hypothetical protein BH09PLA1_BH09PLA1_27020 [soil metagenome]
MRSDVKKLSIAAVCALASSWASAPAVAVVQYATADRNTSAPTGSFANSGWQWQGQWGGFLGTVISKKYFITADHFGGAKGQNFVYQGRNIRTVEVWGDPKSDLRIYKCVGTFDTWAPLFKDSSEVGRSVVVYGRGRERGEEVIVNDELKGWKWGADDGAQSWGRNGVSSIINSGPANSDLLMMTFDRIGGSYESSLSGGDSGGGVFVSQGNKWKLAGVNYSVDGKFSTSTDGSNLFDASIFDRGGLYTQGVGFTSDQKNDIATASYSTRISSRMDWIMGVFNGTVAPGIFNPDPGPGTPAPEPTAAVSAIALAGLAMRRRARRG